MTATMFTVGKAWQSQGISIATEIDSAAGIIKAGLNFEVALEQLYTKGGIAVPGKYATVRTDNGQPLGVVGRRYRVVQNTNSFSAVDSVIGKGACLLHTAGSLGNGEIVWILAKMPGHMMIVKDDVVEKYIMLVNRHDGQASFQMMVTPIRLIGNTTLNISVGGSTVSCMSARHTTNVLDRIQDVEEFIRMAMDHYILFESKSKALVNKQVTPLVRTKFLTAIINRIYKDPKAKKSMSRATDTWDTIVNLMDNGSGTTIAGVKGTAWAAFTAVAEFADYYRPTRKTNGSDADTQRSKSLLFGDSQDLKQFAFDKISELVGVR